jgi:hypothetical protein
MKIKETEIGGRLLVLVAAMALALSGAAIGQHTASHGGGGGGAHLSGGAHQHFDGRYSHNQYYYNRGYRVHSPPAGGQGEFHGTDGGRYWFHGGHWYRWDRGGWAVWGAPKGLFVPFLPFYFTTVWWDGIPYYYANDTYYLWNDDQNQYQVVAPPDGIESGGIPQPPASNQLFIYPKNGQSTEQRDKDRYECHRWAVSQSGFDPTVSGGGVPSGEAVAKRNEYFSGQAACLEGRGYTVK